jgi:hypothetical protein
MVFCVLLRLKVLEVLIRILIIKCIKYFFNTILLTFALPEISWSSCSLRMLLEYATTALFISTCFYLATRLPVLLSLYSYPGLSCPLARYWLFLLFLDILCDELCLPYWDSTLR